jgi:fumarate hydratase class II
MSGPQNLPSRQDTDSIGTLTIPSGKYYGVQTLRSLQNFPFTDPSARMPMEIVKAQATVKKCCAIYNKKHAKLSPEIADAIIGAATEIITGSPCVPADQFPLTIYQTGSGTQTNMNLNEVIASRATHTLSSYDDSSVGNRTSSHFIHPNDHVNLGQSSNDSYPTALHMAVVGVLKEVTLPGLEKLLDAFRRKAAEYEDVVKIGRTHCQDATPLTFGQVSLHVFTSPRLHVFFFFHLNPRQKAVITPSNGNNVVIPWYINSQYPDALILSKD